VRFLSNITELLNYIQSRSDPDTPKGKEQRLTKQKMAQERKRIAKDWLIAGLQGNAKQRSKRALNAVVRKRLKPYSKRPKISRDQRVLLMRGPRSSVILDRLYPERTKPNGWTKLRDRADSSDVTLSLENFSLLDDPERTLANLRLIATEEAKSVGVKINFEDNYCLDVSPFMLLMEFWQHMIPVFEGGKMNKPLQKVLFGLGIPQAMGISVNAVTDLEDVWAFPLCRRRTAGSTVSKASFTDVQRREVANDEFCMSVDEWLHEVGMELSENGTAWIKNILGELLENAERHSDGTRMDGTWSVSGCMVRRKVEATNEWRLQVYIGIVNLGDTFSESLLRATQDTRDLLDRYIARMKKIGAPQSTETLRTLAALQDTITCVASAEKEDRGGYGLQEMIDLVNILGATSDSSRLPRITIVSGKSCIQLRHPYIQGVREGGDDKPRVLWCNESNDNNSAPDTEYVYDLSTDLPGTAISIGFELDDSYYAQVMGGGKNDAND
tara:strand:+ start:6542 stop:8035 length:1494 start_codon:yes stop_codon:yes gene_type:complete